MRLIICPEGWGTTDELVVFWGVVVNSIENRGRKQVKSRGIFPGHKVLQVFVDPFEPKPCESGKRYSEWAEVNVSFPGQDKIEGIRIQVRVLRGWSTRKQVAIASGEMYPE